MFIIQFQLVTSLKKHKVNDILLTYTSYLFLHTSSTLQFD